MANEDDDRPRKAGSHEIGQDLAMLSVEGLTGRIALLRSEIERIEQAPDAALQVHLVDGRGAREADLCHSQKGALRSDRGKRLRNHAGVQEIDR